MVLHHVTNDPKLIKVPASAVRSKRLLEGDEDIGNVVAVPDWLEDGVSKSRMGGRRSNKVVSADTKTGIKTRGVSYREVGTEMDRFCLHKLNLQQV